MLKKRTYLTEREFIVNENKYLYPNCDVSVWLRSCEEEITKPIIGRICGVIPQWLNGYLLRNGPGSMKVGDQEFEHLFDSAALLHKFDISNGKVSYQCRFIRSESYKQNHIAKRIVVNSYGTKVIPDPCHTIFQRISTVFQDQSNIDNASISIYPFGDEFYAFTECPIIQRINPENLETMGKINMREHVNVVNHTSHPFVMSDRSVFNLGLSMGSKLPKYSVIHFPNVPNMFNHAKIVAQIPVRWPMNPSYMHTFGITENYFIIIEQPLSISMLNMVRGKIRNDPLASAFKWFPDECTLFHVVSRSNAKIKCTYKTSTFFFLHVIGSYEIEDYIVIDICCYRDPSVLDCMYVDAMENMHKIENYANMFQSRPLRFILPLNIEKNQTISNFYSRPIWNYLKSWTTIGTKEKCFLKWNNIGNLFERKTKKSRIPIADTINDNLIQLKGSNARAYSLEDKNIFCIPEILCDLGCETPRINEKMCLGKKYRYFYAISSDVDIENPGTLIKVDTTTKKRLEWNERYCYPSEPIFVPSPNAEAEDDGVVLSAMIWSNENENKVGLLVLCAKNFNEIGRCVFNTPGPVPKCLHGWYQSRSDM